MHTDLERYADLAIGVGLNLQPGQHLVIRAPIEAVELTRALAARAYAAGCPYVDVSYSDDQLQLVRFRHAPADSFEEFPAWRVRGMIERAEQGAPFLTVAGGNPDLLKGQDPEAGGDYHARCLRAVEAVQPRVHHHHAGKLVRDRGRGGALGGAGVSRSAGSRAGGATVGCDLPGLPRG